MRSWRARARRPRARGLGTERRACATRFGIPLSTTHTITSAIVGVGATRGGSAVNWGVTQRLVFAWILTFPICGFISWAVVWTLRHFMT